MINNRPLLAHLSLFGACAGWGLMAPVGKAAMTSGISGIDMVAFRVVGAAILFWLTSLFSKRERVAGRDKLLFFFAAIFGLVCNQCCFTIGLSITSPINASIVTTSMPIFAMIFAALILHEPITGKKAAGVFIGCCGAVMLIMSSVVANSDKAGEIKGDLLCLCAQLSYALYLSLFRNLVRRYSLITVNKWMFSYASIIITPIAYNHVTAIQWSQIALSTWAECAYVVVVGTFLAYILMMNGQQTLRPTVVSVYNYVQPIVSVIVSLAAGIAVFGWSQALAVVLVFTGVWMVTKSKSRADMERQKAAIKEE